ncbi:MAG: hypothetical protein JKX72_12330 [Robiginitomaculum sp.]|nr:hypothetical protein [Robiginitomaculum sp.]
MQTPTHAILALALLAKNGDTKRNRIILAGSLIPDLFIYICWIWLSAHGLSQETIWNEIYFQSSVQFWSGFSNSIPMYSALALLGYTQRKTKWGLLLLVFALAALSHMATDFPFHAEDAHQHFWPLTTWKFHSPLSYWDSNHYGRIVGGFETLLALSCIALLLKRLTGKKTQTVLKIFFGLYLLSLIVRLSFWFGFLGG